MKKTNLITWLLLIVMIVSTFAGCNTHNENKPDDSTNETTQTVSEEPSDNETGNDTEKETEKETEAETGNLGGLDTTPLSLKPREDLFPEHSEYETSESLKVEKFDIRVEAEHYASSTIPWTNKVYGNEFSNGVLMRCLGNAVNGWDTVYSVTYKVTVPAAGKYRLTVLSSDIDRDYTSDYTVTTNSQKPIHCSDFGKIVETVPSSALGDQNLLKIINMGHIDLIEGENTIVFTIDNEDSKASQNRLSFFFDYFELSFLGGIFEGLQVSYDVSLEGQENSDIISAAANVSVFDCRYPIRLNINHYFEASDNLPYTVTDYFGKTLYEGVVSGNENEMVSVQRCVKNHPTGYFLLKCGDEQMGYVVTTSYAERTLEDSPFAMDYAATMHNKKINNCFSVSAAARLAGVTWVRDRASWSAYEQIQGQYDFTSTEECFKAIDKAGLKLLVDLCPSPQWAYASEGYNGKDIIGGFRNNQLAFYRLCKEMVQYYDGVVDAWELWNESDIGFAVETSELFSAFYKAGALGVYDANPNMTVALGGLCLPNDRIDYMHLTLLNDVLQYSSFFNYHSHVVQPGNLGYQTFTSPYGMAGSASASLSLYNDLYQRPVWVTEAGMRVDKMEYNSYIQQANYIVTSTVESLSFGTNKHFWFLLAPYMENGGDFGTFSETLEPYPTLAAESVMTSVLGKAEYLGEPIGLSSKAYGYIFNNGTRLVSVLWSTKKGDTYIIKTTAPIIVTDIMGNESLMEPDEYGKISLRLSSTPIYVTYSIAPDFYSHDKADYKIQPLTYTLGQRVVLSPEFENYDVNNPDIKANGHLVSDGIKVKVRVTNYNDVKVTGNITATLEGFEVIGTDKEITVDPYSEGYITLTLKKTGNEPVNSYITFTGTFNGEKTSNSTAHVHTEGAEDTGSLTVNSLSRVNIINKDKLSKVTATLEGATGTPRIILNDKEFDNYTFENNVFTIDLSGLEEGRYTMVIAVKTNGGDYIFNMLVFTFDGSKVTVDHYYNK